MLGRMITGGQLQLQNGPPLESADYTVASDSDWDTVFSNTAATLSGKTLQISGSNFTQREIANLDIYAIGAPLVIRSADASSTLPAIRLSGTVRGIDFSGLNFQMTGWPNTYGACFIMGTGTFGKLRFLHGTTFRHGYGDALANFDTSAELPEYDRIDHVQTATSAGSNFPLTWKDASIQRGWIEFFNRGPWTVHVAVGGSDVSVTTNDTAVLAGKRLRISPLEPAVATHFAVLAVGGSSQVNARTEIGLSEYLCDSFQQEGGATLEDIEIRNCLFRDLGNGVKGLRPTTRGIIMDNDFERIYQDIIALAPLPGASLYVLRNIECLPFSRSGIAENLNGDARDPHGDQFQMFGIGTGTLGPVFYAGNRIKPTARRAGTISQGVFVSDNDVDPSYTNLYLVSTMQVGGSGRALSLGEEGTAFKTRDTFVYGATVFAADDINSNLPNVTIDHDKGRTGYIGRSISTKITATYSPLLEDNNFILSTAPNRTAVFPNLGKWTGATNRAQIEAAFSTGAEGAGFGAVATTHAIDWTTSDYSQVIKWANLPSGAHWNDLTNQSLDTVITLPLRKIMNRRETQTVSVGEGTEWRSVDTDGATQIQAWTANGGTIEPGQYIQIRRTSSAIGGETVAAVVTINGFVQSVAIKASNELPEWLVQQTPPGYFVDPANVPAGTNRITFRGWFYFPSSVPNNVMLFTQESSGCDLNLLSSGSLRVTVEDGTGTKMLSSVTAAPSGAITSDTWHEIEFDADQTTKEVRLSIDGTTTNIPFEAAGNGVFQANRKVSLIATTNGTSALPEGARMARLSVDFNGIMHKQIDDTTALANTDLWKRGGVLGQGTLQWSTPSNNAGQSPPQDTLHEVC